MATLVRERDALRGALAGRAHLLGDTLSYADVALGVTLQFVAPVDPQCVPLGPAARIA